VVAVQIPVGIGPAVVSVSVIGPLQDAAGKNAGGASEVLWLAAQIAEAVAHLHQRPIVRRFNPERRLECLHAFRHLFRIQGGLPAQEVVDRNRRWIVGGQLRISLRRLMLAESLVATLAQYVESLR